uniref:Uncharacterized protein LOC102803389 n=1 Tax=Saccoglossus kowalevskii TaxID=10224 RepID=A0ABM0MP11_SACKO|nr:PREDICTED: uncharacterized protein LOC102803389 [Saccoglossus kowalevskii]
MNPLLYTISSLNTKTVKERLLVPSKSRIVASNISSDIYKSSDEFDQVSIFQIAKDQLGSNFIPFAPHKKKQTVSLDRYLKSCDQNVASIWKISRDIAMALQYLQENKIVHKNVNEVHVLVEVGSKGIVLNAYLTDLAEAREVRNAKTKVSFLGDVLDYGHLLEKMLEACEKE